MPTHRDSYIATLSPITRCSALRGRCADPANPLGSLNRFLTSAFTNDSTGARTAWDLVPESVRHADYGDVIAAYLPLVRGDYAEAIRLESVVIVVAWRRWNLPS